MSDASSSGSSTRRCNVINIVRHPRWRSRKNVNENGLSTLPEYDDEQRFFELAVARELAGED